MLLGLSVCWLEVMFAIGFVCWLGGYVCYWVCLFGLFHCRIKAIPWILSYKWADYWPYWEFIYLFFSMWPFFVMCITMGYFFHVWGGVGVGLFVVFLFCDKYLY